MLFVKATWLPASFPNTFANVLLATSTFSAVRLAACQHGQPDVVRRRGDGHSVTKLEGAVLEYLGRFSNAELVKQYLDAADREELMKLEAQLHDIERRLADSESGFLKKLDDLLTRNVLNEAEFDKANRAEEHDRNARLQAQRVDIKARLDAERDRTELAERLPLEMS